MGKIKLIFQYDGTGFSGYELQPGKRTIRDEIEKALQKVFKQKIKINASSRTDSGVHALCQTISFETPAKIPVNKIPLALNACLPEDIRCVKAEAKAKGFNARFDAKWKEYEYLIFNGEIMPPHLRSLVWHVKPKLNLSAMRKAAKILTGKHDFSSFCASGGDDHDFVRTIHSFDICHLTFVIWGKEKIKLVKISVVGDGFLYKMVRNLVGTLVDIGMDKIPPQKVTEIIKAKDRRAAGRTAPARGLCLIRIDI